MRADEVSRRALLTGTAAAAGLALAGCRDEPAAPRVSRDLRRRGAIAAEVSALADLYAGVLDRVPAASAELATLAAEHAAHVDALLGPPAARRLLRRAATSSPTASAAPSPSASAPTVPATLPEARADLAAAETAASRRRAGQSRTAEPGTARLLASIAACNAVHADLLRAGP